MVIVVSYAWYVSTVALTKPAWVADYQKLIPYFIYVSTAYDTL